MLAKVTVPVFVTHGKLDEILDPGAAEEIASLIKGAKLSWYEFAGHSPFWEEPTRFNSELTKFVKEASAR